MSKSNNNLTEPEKKIETVNQTHQKSSYTGKTPKQVVNKHIQDVNDVITEEDFKNLNISIEIPNDTSHLVLEIPDDHERPKDKDKDPVIITPWDVIKSD